MSQALADSTAKLAGLEQHKHAAARSHWNMKRSERFMHEFGDEPEVAAQHKADMERHRAERAAHLKKHADSGVTDRDIDRAAQAVLNARGEKHTDQKFVGGAEYKAPSATVGA